MARQQSNANAGKSNAAITAEQKAKQRLIKKLKDEILADFDKIIMQLISSEPQALLNIGWRGEAAPKVRDVIDKLYKYIDIQLEEAYKFEYTISGVIEEVSQLASGTQITENILSHFYSVANEELDKAIKKNKEFNHPKLLNPLKKAFNNPELYAVNIAPGKHQASVVLNKDLILGTVDDLGAAITAAREQLNYGDVQEGEKATRSWYMNLYAVARDGRTYYKVDFDKVHRVKRATDERNFKREAKSKALYWRILKARLDFLGQRPAYWVLLNDGDANVKLTSDKSGKGSPTVTATHFVDIIERKLNKYLSERVSGAVGKENLKEATDRIEVNRKRIEVLEGMAVGVDNISRNLVKLFGYTPVEDLTPLFKKWADPSKFLTATKKTAASAPGVPGPTPAEKQTVKTEGARQAKQQEVIKALDGIIKTAIISKKDHLKFLEMEDNSATEAMMSRLRILIVKLASGEDVPNRLYVGTRSNVKLKLRTKIVKDEILELLNVSGIKLEAAKDLDQIGKALKELLDRFNERTRKENLALGRVSKNVLRK